MISFKKLIENYRNIEIPESIISELDWRLELDLNRTHTDQPGVGLPWIVRGLRGLLQHKIRLAFSMVAILSLVWLINPTTQNERIVVSHVTGFNESRIILGTHTAIWLEPRSDIQRSRQ